MKKGRIQYSIRARGAELPLPSSPPASRDVERREEGAAAAGGQGLKPLCPKTADAGLGLGGTYLAWLVLVPSGVVHALSNSLNEWFERMAGAFSAFEPSHLCGSKLATVVVQKKRTKKKGNKKA